MVDANTTPLLELELILAFVTIVETGNFTTAAKTLHRTPSAVSMQIKKLELAVGGSVFQRDSRTVTLTPKGEILLGFSRRMLALNDSAVAHCVSPDLVGVVRVGAPDDIASEILPNALKRLTAALPNVTVDTIVSNDSKRNDDGRKVPVDIEIRNRQTKPEADGRQFFFREKLVWVGAKSGTAHLRDPLPISLAESGPVWREHTEDRLKKAGRSFRVAYLTTHPTSAYGAIGSDLAIAPLPKYLVRNELRILGAADGLPDLGEYYISVRATATTSPSVSAVRQQVERALLQKFQTRID